MEKLNQEIFNHEPYQMVIITVGYHPTSKVISFLDAWGRDLVLNHFREEDAHGDLFPTFIIMEDGRQNLEDSELADNEIVQVSTFQEILDEYMPLDRTNNIWGYNVNKQFDRWENKDGTLK